MHLVCRLTLEQAREIRRDVHRLALGQVEQDRRDVAAVGAEIDAVDDVRLVLARRELRGLAVRRDLRQRIDGRAARRSEEHTSELQSLMRISYAVFCLKKQKHKTKS